MDVSIIIVNYNTKDILADCLLSIIKETINIDYEIIVVDNDSHDGSQKMLKNRFPNVKVIESGKNLGFGKANNLGMQHAKGKYFFLLNSDTLLLNNAIKIFYDYSEANPGFGALGCILLDRDKNPCHSYGKFHTPLKSLKDVIAKYLRFLKDSWLLHPDYVEAPLSVDYITGADLWVPKAVYEKTGGFDKDFFMYFEEVDWQLRMKLEGYDRIIIPGPKIIHLEGGSDSDGHKFWTKNRLKNLNASREIYECKHFNKFVIPLYRIAYHLLNLPSVIMISLARKFHS